MAHVLNCVADEYCSSSSTSQEEKYFFYLKNFAPFCILVMHLSRFLDVLLDVFSSIFSHGSWILAGARNSVDSRYL